MGSDLQSKHRTQEDRHPRKGDGRMLLKLPNIGLQRIVIGGAASHPDFLDAKGEVELAKGESILSPHQQKSLKHLLAEQKSKSILRQQALVSDSTLRSRVSNSKSTLVAKNLFQNEVLDHHTALTAGVVTE